MESLPWDDVQRCGGLDVESELVLSLGGESKAEDASVRSNILSAATANFSVMEDGDEFGECCGPMMITKRGEALSKRGWK